MEKKFYQTKEFKELFEKWDKKLEESGFEDHEKALWGTLHLKQRALNVYRESDITRIEAKETYFKNLAEFVEVCEFDCEVDRIVMENKSQGATIKEICEVLKLLGQGRCRGMVRFIVRKYENKWQIKKWPPHQLDYQWRKNRRTR